MFDFLKPAQAFGDMELYELIKLNRESLRLSEMMQKALIEHIETLETKVKKLEQIISQTNDPNIKRIV